MINMGYIESIKTAIFIFPFIAFIFTLPFILHQYHKYGSIHKLRVLIIYSFILYLITIYFLVILPLPDINSVTAPVGDTVKLIPFSFINDFIRESSIVWNEPSTYLKALTEPCFYVVAFNILMTIPFGMYLRYYFKCSLKKVLLYRYKRTAKVYKIKITYVKGVDKAFFKLMQNFIKKPNLITWMALICDLIILRV